jgi:hypothetical protein
MLTLAHLSDPHLAPLPKPHWSELIGKRVTGYVNWQRKRRFIHDPAVLSAIAADIRAHAPDHIAVTGDIANIALPAEFLRGRDWLESLGSAQDVTFVPGNHDIYVREAGALAARQWGAYMCDDDGETGFPFVRRRANVALIGLSTGVPTAPFLATGWLGTKQLAEFAAILNKLKDEDFFRVILIHHPPVSDVARHKRLMDGSILKRVIAAHGADLLLHGHDHLRMINWLQGPKGTRIPAFSVQRTGTRQGCSRLQSLQDRRRARRLALRHDFARLRLRGRDHAAGQDKIDWLGPCQHGERDEPDDAGKKPEEEHACGSQAPLAASVMQDRLRDAAADVIGKRALTLDQPASNVTFDGIRHCGHFIGLREHRAAIARALHETILPLVAAHLDMRNDVDPKARNVTLAHTAIEEVHVVRNFVEYWIKRIVEQIQPRNIRIPQVDDDARALGCFDARLAHRIFQRLWSVVRSLVLIFFVSPHELTI